MKDDTPQLSRRERQIMDAVYRLERATVAEIRAALDDPPSYSTVRALIKILERKSHLRHHRDSQRYVYEATVPRHEAAGAALQRVVRTFFDGSVTDLVSTLIHGDVHESQLDEIAALIAKARKETP